MQLVEVGIVPQQRLKLDQRAGIVLAIQAQRDSQVAFDMRIQLAVVGCDALSDEFGILRSEQRFELYRLVLSRIGGDLLHRLAVSVG